MKKKFVKVALLSLTACTMPAAFVSCDNDDWKAPVNDVESSVDGLNKTLTEMKGQVSSLDSKIAENKSAAEAANAAAKAAMEAAQAAGTSAEDAKKYADEAAQKFAEEAAAKAMAESAEQLKAEVETLMAQIQANKGATEENKTQIATVAGKCEALGNDVADLKVYVEEEIGKIALSSDLEAVAALAQKAETQIAALEAFQEKMTTDFAALSTKVDGIDATVEQNKTDIAKLTAELTALKENADKNVEGLQELIQNNTDDIKTLETFKTTYEPQLKTLATDLQNLSKEIDTKVTAAVNTMTAAFLDNLRGLVFIPEAYVGGVESALSYHMDYLKLNPRANTPAEYTTGDFKVSKYQTWNLELVNDKKNAVSFETPTLISYHMNPLSAQVAFDQLSIVEKNAELLTRAEGAGIKLDPNYNDGKGLKIDNEKGVLTLSITGNSINYDPKGTTMPIFALQAQVAGKVNEEGEQEMNTVTSDYAVFAQMNVEPAAIQYNMSKYWNTFNKANEGDYQEVVTTATNVADINSALNNATASTVKWNGSVNLLEVLEISYKDLARGTNSAWTTPSDWEKYGLQMNFALVDYTIGANNVSESSWAVIDPATGVLTACVNGDASKQSTDELGHMPLVYVTVTKGDDTVLNGFLKVKIVPSEDYYVTDPVKYANIDFNCDGFAEDQEPGYEPLKLILKATGLSREIFLANYKPMVKDVDFVVEGNSETNTVFVQYIKNGDTWTVIPAAQEIGYITDNSKVMNNELVYDYGWYFDDAYAKQLVYQQANHTATVYICFKGQSDVYADVYVPLMVTVNDKANDLTVGEKVLAKWFRENNNTALLNVPQPTNGKFVTTIAANLDQYWTGDKPKFAPVKADYQGYKYYFSAANNSKKVTKVIDGKEVTVTFSVKNATNPNLINGVYGAKAEANAKMGDNALLVNGEASEYNNTELFANNVKIATLNQTTGEITYETTPEALVYLNMFDSMGGEDRPEAKLGGIVGMVAYNKCDIAYNVTNGDFNVAFLRPINVDPTQVYPFQDATANGSVNNVYEMLAFSDWRNINFKGNNNEWLYAYYNVKSVKADFTKMTTTINNPAAGKFEAASPSLQECFVHNGGDVTFGESAVNSGNSATIKAQVESGFGQIIYNNSKVNVKSFKVRIPFVVEYELGKIEVTIECDINTTLGN